MRYPDFKFENKSIVIFSPEPWGANLLSKHHIALTLANRGNHVWFISNPVSGQYRSPAKPHEGIDLIEYRSIPGVNLFPKPIARILSIIERYRIQKRIGSAIDIVWSFDPYQFQFLKLLKASLYIYHPVDNHYTSLESWVVEESDVIISNSSLTLQRIRHEHKYKIGHGVASYFFDPVSNVKLPGDYKIRVGYVGNLNNRLLDFNILKKLVLAHPELGFYLVGPRASSNLASTDQLNFNWEELDKLPNIFWLGQQPSRLLPSYIRQFDVLLILYRPDHGGLTVNPHKILEYLSSGNLIITPAHNENGKIKELILEAETIENMPEVFSYGIEHLDEYLSTEMKKKRVAKASLMSYENRLEELEVIIRTKI